LILNNSTIHFKKQGHGATLIVLHGIFGSGDNWQTLANNFQDQYTVYLIDQRNHGKSFHSDDFDLDVLADDIYKFIIAESLSNVHVLAHSMGGKVALKLLSLCPQLLDKIIIVDIAPKAYPAGHEDIFRAMMEMPFSEIKSRTEADQHMLKYITDPMVRQFILKNLSRTESGGFEWKLNLKSIFDNYEKILLSIYPEIKEQHEVLFILGENSNYIKAIDKTAILEKYPHAKFETIPHAGHWVHADNFEAFVSVVKKYLQN